MRRLTRSRFPGTPIRNLSVGEPVFSERTDLRGAKCATPSVMRLLLAGVLVTGCSDSTGPGGGARGPEVERQIAVSLQTHDLVYDSIRGVIYASVASTSATHANTISAIDPSTGAVVWSVNVGSDPGVLDISDDGTVLWVGLRGTPAIQRIDLAQRSAAAPASLGTDPWFGPLFAEDLDVLPGTSESVAVSLYRRGVSPRHGGVAIYDSGARRPVMTQDHTGSNRIEASDLPSTLYGFNNETSEFGFRRLAVDDTGVREATVTGSVVQQYDVDMEYGGGRIYFTNGAVVDPAAGTLVGTIPARGFVRPDPARNRVYFLEAGATTLWAFDTQTLTLSSKAAVAGVAGSAGSLILIGRSGLAFRTPEQVVIVPVSILAP